MPRRDCYCDTLTSTNTAAQRLSSIPGLSRCFCSRSRAPGSPRAQRGVRGSGSAPGFSLRGAEGEHRGHAPPSGASLWTAMLVFVLALQIGYIAREMATSYNSKDPLARCNASRPAALISSQSLQLFPNSVFFYKPFRAGNNYLHRARS